MKNLFEKTAIVPKTTGALATTDLAELGKIARDQVAKEDLPRASLRILQDLSPQVKAQSAKYLDGAKPGMIFNTSTREVYDGSQEKQEIAVLICKYSPKYIEWLPGRKGFVGEHEIGSEITLPENLSIVTENERRVEYSKITKNVMVKTAIYHCLAFLKGSVEPEEVVIDMTSTNWGTARLLNSHFQNAKIPNSMGVLVKAPIFTWVYQLFHEYQERSDKNQSWFTWNFKPLVIIDDLKERRDDYIRHALEYRDLIQKGKVDFDYRREQQE
jgi:hypothetical protein